MGSQHPYTSSGSKSRDTRGDEPSQQDVSDELKKARKESESAAPPNTRGDGLSGDSVGEETLDRSGAANGGSSGTQQRR